MKILQKLAFSIDRNDGEKFKDGQSEISIIVTLLFMHRFILSYTEIEQWLQHSPNNVFPSLLLTFGKIILQSQ